MVETGSGGAAAPWLVNGFEITQETPYTFPDVASFNCEPNRGPPDAAAAPDQPLAVGVLVAGDRRRAGQRPRRAAAAGRSSAASERGQIANFVAVNYVAIGDLFDVVDELNGVG